MKKIVLALIILPSVVMMNTVAWSKDESAQKDPGSALIEKLANNQVKVTKVFPTPVGWIGHVVTPKGKGRNMIMYSNKPGTYLFFGNIVSADGKNLTSEYSTRYINASIAKKASKTIASTSFFQEGSDSAPHKLYLFFDPNCSGCNVMYQSIHPYVEKGRVQVRWVPVAFLRPTSAGIAVHMLSGKDDKERSKLLNKDEMGFDMSKEQGGLEPLEKTKANKELFKAVEKNTDYFVKQGFYATPTLIYADKNGIAAYKLGAVPTGAPMDEFLKGVSSSWEMKQKKK